MKVGEAKELVLTLMRRDLDRGGHDVTIDGGSPDPSDPGKFMIDGKPARAVHPRDGCYVQVNQRWFAGGFQRPQINDGEFSWYVFAMPRRKGWLADHYVVAYETDYDAVREAASHYNVRLLRVDRGAVLLGTA